MSNTITDLIIAMQNEAVAFDKKARVVQGSDRKVFRKLAGLTKDHTASVQEAFMLVFTRPLMEIITPEFARTLVAGARETNRGVGQAFKESANAYIQQAAKAEQETLGGVVFTKAILEYLNLVNWTYIGQYVESLAGDPEIDVPIPKSCGRNDCTILEQRVPKGWLVQCSTCKRTTEINATKPQAVKAWNELIIDKPKVEMFDTDKAVQLIRDAGYNVNKEEFESWKPDDQGAALNFVSSGGKLPEPDFLKSCRDDRITDPEKS